MALQSVKTGQVQILADSSARAYTLPPVLRGIPGGLYPMRTAAFEVDEYRILFGWPVPIPPMDIHCTTLVSADGAMLANRETPTGVLTGANYRWVADDNFFNQTTGQWVPIQGGAPIWSAAPTALPSLINNYEYTIDDERFIMSALNFDSDTHDMLSTDIGRVMSTAYGYTVLFVMSPNSVFGNDVAVSFNTLWASPEDPSLTSLNLTLMDDHLWAELTDKPNQPGIAMLKASATSAPTYLAVVVNRPRMTMYLGSGPSDILSKRLPIGPVSNPLSTSILLGQHPDDALHNMDMALFDLGLYANPLTADQVRGEFTLLSKIYGGN